MKREVHQLERKHHNWILSLGCPLLKVKMEKRNIIISSEFWARGESWFTLGNASNCWLQKNTWNVRWNLHRNIQHCERSELRLHFEWTKVHWGQTVLPDRSLSIWQKLVGNAQIQKFKWDILSDFLTVYVRRNLHRKTENWGQLFSSSFWKMNCFSMSFCHSHKIKSLKTDNEKPVIKIPLTKSKNTTVVCFRIIL